MQYEKRTTEAQKREAEELVGEVGAMSDADREHWDEVGADLDELLDEIDAVLSENTTEMAAQYRQVGGE